MGKFKMSANKLAIAMKSLAAIKSASAKIINSIALLLKAASTALATLAALATLVIFGSSQALAQDDGDDKDVVFAAESEESIQFRHRGVRQSYHCDFVRAETRAILRKLGATQIEVICRGGLPNNSYNYVNVSFVSLRETTSDKSTKRAYRTGAEMQFSQRCDLRQAIVENVLNGFDVYDFAQDGECRQGLGQVFYSMKTLQ